MVIILILTSLGILDAGFLSYVHLFGAQACGQWAGCSYVLASPYSRIFGVPVSTIGLGVYLCLTFLALQARDPQNRADAVRWIFYISLTGTLMSAYFIFLQALVIKHWCPFCLLSAILMFSIFALNLLHCRIMKDFTPLLKSPKWSFGPKAMLILLILPSLTSLGIEQVISVASTKSILSDSKKVVARIGERTITLGEVDHGIRLILNQIEWKGYEIRLLWLENELLSMEATRQGISAKDLIKNNIDDAVSVSEEEIQKVYESNQKGQLAEIPYEKVKEQLSTLLKSEKKKLRRQEFLTQLKQSHNVSFSLPKPLSLTLEDNPRNGPVKGPAEAALTVVIFTDFECPFCSKAYQQIKDLLARHPQDVRFVFRHFPSDTHKNAHTAAYAAACAHLQGKFWQYADLLFKNQRNLGFIKLYDYARQVGLDMEKFKQCMESERAKEIVDADVAEGLELGISTTPTLFFNGHFLKGAPKPRQLQFFLDQYLPKPDEQESKK